MPCKGGRSCFFLKEPIVVAVNFIIAIQFDYKLVGLVSLLLATVLLVIKEMMMMGFFSGGVVVLVLCQLLAVVVVHGAPTEHLVQQLPGQPLVGFKQYSGYIEVDESSKTNLFYYFVEAEANSSSLPLALWLNGGPGCSSIGGGAFTELGPFYPNKNGHGLRRNPYSWNKVANLLFLESPAGVGWSYSENKSANGDYSYDDWKVAKETLAFMRKWFSRFQEYRTHKLLLTGESYAGHYIPQLASLMLNSHPLEFNLKGILIGNPLLNYAVDTSATYSYLWSHGVISDQTFRGVSRWCDFRFGYMGGGQVEGEQKVEKDIKRKLRKEKRGCTSFLGSARDEMGSYINIYDVTSDVCPPPSVHQAILIQKLMGLVGDDVKDVCVDHEISRYLNQKLVQQVLHANVTSLPYPWEACSSIVDYSANDQLADILPLLVSLVKKRLPVWIFSGDQDSVVPLTGTRSQIAKLAQHVNMKPREKYQPWYANGQVGGWYEAYGDGRVLYATVRGASHMVPYTQPERALVLFTSFVGGGRRLPSRP